MRALGHCCGRRLQLHGAVGRSEVPGLPSTLAHVERIRNATAIGYRGLTGLASVTC